MSSYSIVVQGLHNAHVVRRIAETQLPPWKHRAIFIGLRHVVDSGLPIHLQHYRVELPCGQRLGSDIFNALPESCKGDNYEGTVNT